MITPSAQPPLSTTVVDAARLLGVAISQVQRAIVGQEHMVQQLMVALLAKGHCLPEGVSGVVKTLAVRSLATVVGGDFARAQLTPDLIPFGIVGIRIYSVSPKSPETELGPAFVNFALADEISRVPAKVQFAILELMAEKQAFTGGRTYSAPESSIATATQNLVESEGAHPPPEAQRDRFPAKVNVPYPKGNEEFEILGRVSVKPPQAKQVLNPGLVHHLQDMASKVFVCNLVNEYIVRLVLATRNPTDFGMLDPESVAQISCPPRATLGLVAASRSLALINGRNYVLSIDVQAVTRDVMSHRTVLGFDVVADNVLTTDMVDRTLAMVPAFTPVWDNQSRQQCHQQHGYQPGHA